MKKLEPLFDRTFFTTLDVANLLGYSLEYARVFCTRYTKKGVFIKLRKGLYVLSFKWRYLTTEDLFKISAFLRVPSYISLTTALSYYRITTQMQQGYFESITIKNSKYYEIEGVIFKYYKVNGKFFDNYEKRNGYFMATREKAYLDAIYLYSFGKHRLDIDSIDYSKLNKDALFSLAEGFPKKTIKTLEKLWKN